MRRGRPPGSKNRSTTGNLHTMNAPATSVIEINGRNYIEQTVLDTDTLVETDVYKYVYSTVTAENWPEALKEALTRIEDTEGFFGDVNSLVTRYMSRYDAAKDASNPWLTTATDTDELVAFTGHPITPDQMHRFNITVKGVAVGSFGYLDTSRLDETEEEFKARNDKNEAALKAAREHLAKPENRYMTAAIWAAPVAQTEAA